MCIKFWNLTLLIFGLLFIWHLTLVTCVFLVRRFVCGNHFSHVCFYVAWTYAFLVLVDALRTNMLRVYSYNFAIWLSHWICCQLSFYCQDNKKKRKIMLMWVTFWGLCSQEIFDNICRLFDCHTGWAFWGRGGRHCYWHLVPLQ